MVDGSAVLAQKIHFSDEIFKISVCSAKTPQYGERAFHEEIEIKYFYDGNAAVMIDSEIYIAEKGDIAFVNPYEIHSVVNPEYYNGRYCLITVDLGFFNDMNQAALDLRYMFLGKGQKIQNLIHADSRLQTIVLRIEEEMCNQSENYRLVVQNLMSEFFVLLFRKYIKEETVKTLGTEKVKYIELLAPAISKIHTDYARKLTLEELADLCNVSKYYFCRVFKRTMGVTPIQYMSEFRINLAEQMLKDLKNSIAEIAWRCGFDDVSYFSRCYKRLKGCSPQSVRKKENI